MQRPQRPRSKSPRQLEREIAETLRASSRRTVPGYSNYGGGGPFAPMNAPAATRAPGKKPSRAHATRRGPAPEPKVGASDKITIDQLAKLLDLPDWERIDEMNQQHYWEVSRGAEGEDAQMEAEREAQDEVYRQWYDAVERTAETLFEAQGLGLLAMKHTRKVQKNYRPHVLKIVPAKTWSDAADKLRETINGVSFSYNNLREFLDSGPYTARQAVLANLGYIKRYPDVYGSTSAQQLYERAW